MAEDTPTTPEKQAAEPDGAANPANEAAPAAGDPTALATEVAEMKDKMLRTLAEMENLRRRTEREVADQRQYAVASFARDMLTVGDNLRRAIEAVPQETRAAGDKTLAALIEGVEMTERGLEQTLTKFGVRRVEAKGQKFDPSFHQAMFEAEVPDAAPGTVHEEIQAGYAIGERVLRPALVSVVKKQAKPKVVESEGGEDAPAQAAAIGDAPAEAANGAKPDNAA